MRKLIWIIMAQLLAAALPGQVLNFTPLFQFQVFYQNDMEIAPNAPMTIGGTVHGNANIYLAPANGLIFSNAVSAAGQIVLGESPLDPSVRTFSSVTFDGPDVSGAAPLILPNGPNTGQSIYTILEPPLPGQTPNSAIGETLFYNRADMIIIVSNNNTISVTSGAGIDNQAIVISSNDWQRFLSTNGAFYDQRDTLTVNPVVIDVSNLVIWSATNTTLRQALSNARGPGDEANVQSIYVADLRNTSNTVVTTTTTVTTITTNTTYTTTTFLPPFGTYVRSSLTRNTNVIPNTWSYLAINTIITTNTISITNTALTSQPGIVLSNGAVLPPLGLSVATPDPVYIVGNWNIKNSFASSAPSDAGLSDTSHTLPSAIFADAITILSQAWNPANSALALMHRIATNDTVNAAFFAGNVPSNGENYSGGLENFPRLLEAWSGYTFTWNGSMCCMFASQIANAPYVGAGAVYSPPARNWAFDNNFSNPAKMPPLTPLLQPVALVPLTVAETNGTIFLTWSASPGIWYNVQYASDLAHTNWNSLGTVLANDISASFSEPATNTQRFYRLQIFP